MLAFWTLVVFMCFSSFAFGCMEPWSIATCEVILFVGAGFAGWRDRSFWRWPKHFTLPALLVLSLVVVGAIQLIPLPVSVWRHFKAERVLIYDEGAQAEMLLRSDAYRRDPFGPDAEKPLPPDNSPLLTPQAPDWIPATFTPMATARGLIAVLAAGCLLMLLQKVSEDARALKALALIVGVLGLLVALVALAQYTEKPSEILWVRASQYAKQAFGPFVNPNHGEAFVNLTFPLLYFLLWHKSLKERKAGNRYGLRVLIAGLLLLHIVLIVISHSRGAYLSLALYPLAYLLHEGIQKRRWAVVLSGAYVAFLVGIGLFLWWSGMLFDGGRLRVYQNVPASHFILGNGLNSFNERWPSIITDLPLLQVTHNTHLENEYLQLFFEGGVAPAILCAMAGAWALVLAFRGLALSHSGFWLAPAFTAEIIHAVVDFTGHVFALVGGLLLIWALLPTRQGAEPSEMPRSPKRGVRTFITCLLPSLALSAAIFNAPTFEKTPWPALIQQGGLRPLIAAESALKANNPSLALHHIEVVALRGHRSSLDTLLLQMRFRLGNAGAQLSEQDLTTAWPMLCRYVLWGDDFNLDACNLEYSLLSRKQCPKEFRYPLMDAKGVRTFWGDNLTKAPIWLFRKCFPDHLLTNWPGKLYNHTARQIPPGPDWTFVFPFALSSKTPFAETQCEMKTPLGREGLVYLSFSSLVQWTAPLAASKDGSFIERKIPRGDWDLDRIVVQANKPPEPFEAYIVHHYMALNF
jgi:hypothetical protein